MLLLQSVPALATPVKVAFIGDQDIGDDARAVLSLVAAEGTDLLLIQGDLGYRENAASAWEANLNEALGPDFPVLAVVGNHENYEWPTYQRLLRERIERAGATVCSGETGVKASCRFGDLQIVQVAVGIVEVEGVSPDDGYDEFIASSFAGTDATWRICSWHRNQNALQTGDNGDGTGWEVYDACLDAGAMVAVAHEHAYSRSFLLSDFENQVVAHTDGEMTLEPGRSFVVVSGLGGREVRPQRRGGSWWASIYTASQGATYGALFCTFDTATADCYFKAIDGAVPDQFTLRAAAAADAASGTPTPPAPLVVASATEGDDGAVDPVAEPAAVAAPQEQREAEAEEARQARAPAAQSSPERLPAAEVTGAEDASAEDTGVAGSTAAAAAETPASAEATMQPSAPAAAQATDPALDSGKGAAEGTTADASASGLGGAGGLSLGLSIACFSLLSARRGRGSGVGGQARIRRAVSDRASSRRAAL